MTEPVCHLDLPVPPSTNNLFVNRRPGQGRARGPAYRAWLKEAGWEIVQQRLPWAHPTLRVRLRVQIDAQLKLNRDLDNSIKAILDLLVKMGVIADDNLIDDLRIVRRMGEGDRCGVAIWPM
jgi:crossover junction endodeoxyribonuclease RusA